MDWKLNIFHQLKDHKRESNLYDEIIEHCILFFINYIHIYLFSIFIDNRLLENNTLLHSQCIKFEKDVQHLRLANAGLEKASEARFVYLNKIKLICLIFFSSLVKD